MRICLCCHTERQTAAYLIWCYLSINTRTRLHTLTQSLKYKKQAFQPYICMCVCMCVYIYIYTHIYIYIYIHTHTQTHTKHSHFVLIQIFVGNQLFSGEILKFALSKMEHQAQKLMNCVPYIKKKPDIGTRKTPERYFVSRNHRRSRSKISVMDKSVKQKGEFQLLLATKFQLLLATKFQLLLATKFVCILVSNLKMYLQ